MLRTGAGMDARLAKRSEAEPELRLGFSITSLMTRCWISSQRTAAPLEQWFAIRRDLCQNGIAWLLFKAIGREGFLEACPLATDFS